MDIFRHRLLHSLTLSTLTAGELPPRPNSPAGVTIPRYLFLLLSMSRSENTKITDNWVFSAANSLALPCAMLMGLILCGGETILFSKRNLKLLPLIRYKWEYKIVKSPRYTEGDLMFLYRFIHRRRNNFSLSFMILYVAGHRWPTLMKPIGNIRTTLVSYLG